MPKGRGRSRKKPINLEKEVLNLQRELSTLRLDSTQLHEKQVKHLQHCGGDENCLKVQNVSKDQAKLIHNQDMYIAYLENEIRQTRTKYETKISRVKLNANMLEMELKKLRNELHEIKKKAEHVDKVEEKAELLRQKLKRRDIIIEQFSTQHTDIMGIIHELQARVALGTVVGTRTIFTQTHSDNELTSGRDSERSFTEHSTSKQAPGSCAAAKKFAFANLCEALRLKIQGDKDSSAVQMQDDGMKPPKICEVSKI